MFQHGQLGLGNKEDRPVPVHVGVEAVSHTHMYTPAHTPTHTHTNTLIHTHTLSYSQTYTLTLTHTHRYRSTHTYTRTRTHKRFIRPSLECGNTTRSICLVWGLFQNTGSWVSFNIHTLPTLGITTIQSLPHATVNCLWTNSKSKCGENTICSDGINR